MTNVIKKKSSGENIPEDFFKIIFWPLFFDRYWPVVSVCNGACFIIDNGFLAADGSVQRTALVLGFIARALFE